MRPLRYLLASAVVGGLVVAAGPAGAATLPTQVLDGTVRIVAVDDSAAGPGRVAAADAGRTEEGGDSLSTIAMADVGGRLVTLPATATALRPGQQVRVTAVARPDGSLSVRSVEPAGEAPGRVAARGVSEPVTGAHTLTVLPVFWSTPDLATRASLTAVATSTAAYWSAQSGGRLTIAPAVRDWARIPDPGTCDPVQLANAALAANGLPIPVSLRTHVVIYFPEREDCGGWAGLGQITGELTWVNGLPWTDVLAHEFGHNLGLGHANTSTCTDAGARVTLSSTCSLQEYRDLADVMGGAMDRPTGNLNTALADWLGLATTVTVPAGTRADVDLVPLGQTAGTRALRIRVGGAWLYADYRPATSPDTRWPAWAGVQLHLLPDGSYPASRLLDGRPGTATAFSTTSLPVGRAWPAPGAGLTITVTSVDGSGAHITVAPTTSDGATPAPVITAPAPGSLVAASVTLSWRLTSAAVVRVLVDGVPRATSSAASRAGSTVVAGLADGPHQLGVQTLDAQGSPTATSVPVSVTADATPPPGPGGLGLSPGDVLSWHAVTDARSGTAGYLVALDGGAPARVGNSVSVRVRVRTPTGRHTWWVAAVDRAGNVSPASGLLVVRTAATRSRPGTVRATGPASTAGVPRTLTTARTVGGTRTF